VLGSPRTLVACALVLFLSWATVGMTRVMRLPSWEGGRDISLPRFHAWPEDDSPRRSAKCILLAPDATGTFEFIEEQAGLYPWDTQREGFAFLEFQRDVRCYGTWAPVTESRLWHARLSTVSWRALPDLGADDRLAHLMSAVPAERRGGWAALWPPDGRPQKVAEEQRVVWWGYLWNAATLAALVGAAAWPFVAPFWFFQWRTERRRARGLCVRCTYQVRTEAGALAVCPECGTSTT